MKSRDNLCLLLWFLALFATARAVIALIKWSMFSATETHLSQPIYGFLLAGGLWWAWIMARRLPTV